VKGNLPRIPWYWVVAGKALGGMGTIGLSSGRKFVQLDSKKPAKWGMLFSAYLLVFAKEKVSGVFPTAVGGRLANASFPQPEVVAGKALRTQG